MRKFSIVLILALATPALAMAQMGGPREAGPGMGKHQPRMADKLGLSQEQMDKMQDIQKKYRLQMIDSRAEMEKAMINFTDILQEENPNQAALKAATEKVLDAKTRLERERLENMIEMSSILTPEQKKKMAQKSAFSRLKGGPGGRQGSGQGNDPGHGPGPRFGSGPGSEGGPGMGR